MNSAMKCGVPFPPSKSGDDGEVVSRIMKRKRRFVEVLLRAAVSCQCGGGYDFVGSDLDIFARDRTKAESVGERVDRSGECVALTAF